MSNKIKNQKSEIKNQKVSAARRAAFEILQKIEAEKAFSAILLPAYEEKLKPEDRALCHALTLGVLRNLSFLDSLIEHFSGKKIEKLDLAVRIALRLGLFQLRFLEKIPARAAVNESVNLVYLAKKRSAAGFVNAVLRKSERELQFNPAENVENPLEKLAVETSHPVWLLEKWSANFGFEETASLARANNQQPATAFRLAAKGNERVLDELKEAGAEIVESKIAPDAFRVFGATQKTRELVEQGKIYLQDEASQLVAHVVDLKADESFIDLCSAPGSKTTHIAQIQNSKFNFQHSVFVAGDVYDSRIKILRETGRKFGGENIKIVQYDAEAALPFVEESFDCVLLDAPCTGTGTIRHNPEIRWHLGEKDFAELSLRQLQILKNASKILKKNGRLIYSTCSLEPEENEDVIARFLSDAQNFRQAKLNLPAKFLTESGAARTFPQRNDVDGFFIALLLKSN